MTQKKKSRPLTKEELETYDYKFIRTLAEHNRIKNTIEAIDSGDTEIYWKDRNKWFQLHEKEKNRRYLQTRTRPKQPDRTGSKLSKKLNESLQRFRDCYGNLDTTHPFCLERCVIGKYCEIRTGELQRIKESEEKAAATATASAPAGRKKAASEPHHGEPGSSPN
ncbi:MAG: hypothetical protein DRP09_10420 [Candidatus Thorarchaeota archaeon]|nr:MAG: hypothetical protein DRP09_10420 [Candidatus Thorarchaeota archaeon]